jgi:L-alanine-DL-glutamate epimerase-like enolase superfamily enzyme
MPKSTDVRIAATELFFLPLQMRVPLKFGAETVTSVTCARACVTVEDARGRRASGWGETPLSVQWVWPSQQPYGDRHERLKRFCVLLAGQLPAVNLSGHAFEVGAEFTESVLPPLLEQFNSDAVFKVPLLAALVCLSAFDLALHDAYGQLHQLPVYQTYNRDFLSRDLGSYLVPAATPAAPIDFTGKFPDRFLAASPPSRLLAWHLVGGLDPIDSSELTGAEPMDGYPVLLHDWIRRDGLKCLKIKLRGNDAEWDYERLVRVGRIAGEESVEMLSADFNCTVTDPAYVNAVLDRLKSGAPEVFDRLLYVEQPFPYELEQFPIDVGSVSARKPLFLDESAHNWKLVRRGRELGWTGVALKTCKTQTGALLSACWARAHGMQLMVQDLTNPMLAQIPHVLLAAHVETIAGVETNAMQFYPEVSRLEECVHPGLYRRRDGHVNLSSVAGPGFGYRLDEIGRELPAPAAQFGIG